MRALMKRVAAIFLRALAGAFAGSAIVGMVIAIAYNNFGYGRAEDPAVFRQFFVRGLAGSAAIGAIVGMLFGAVKIRGQAGATIRSMAYGGLAGVVAGPFLGMVVGRMMMDMPPGLGWFLGIFAGLVLGVIVGGFVGASQLVDPEKKSPALPADVIRDRTPDG